MKRTKKARNQDDTDSFYRRLLILLSSVDMRMMEVAGVKMSNSKLSAMVYTRYFGFISAFNNTMSGKLNAQQTKLIGIRDVIVSLWEGTFLYRLWTISNNIEKYDRAIEKLSTVSHQVRDVLRENDKLTRRIAVLETPPLSDEELEATLKAEAEKQRKKSEPKSLSDYVNDTARNRFEEVKYDPDNVRRQYKHAVMEEIGKMARKSGDAKYLQSIYDTPAMGDDNVTNEPMGPMVERPTNTQESMPHDQRTDLETEDFIFPHPGSGRGSKVETLPGSPPVMDMRTNVMEQRRDSYKDPETGIVDSGVVIKTQRVDTSDDSEYNSPFK